MKERPERTTQGYRRFRCATCGKQSNERSGGLLRAWEAKLTPPLAEGGLGERIQFRRPPRLRLSAPRAKANAARARVGSAVEHVFARQKHRMALFVRAIGPARARMKIG